MRIAVSPKDDNTQASIRALPDALTRDITLALDKGARTLARKSKRLAPKAFSTLTRSIHSRKIGPMQFEVSAGANYAQIVHEGRMPGSKPPVQHILEWIKVKGISPKNAELSLRDLAWIIAGSIERHGTKAQPFMQDAVDATSHKIKQTINAGIRSALGKSGQVA